MFQETYRFLREAGVKVSPLYIKQRVLGHPERLSFIALQDTLEELGITVFVCKGTKEELEKENRPFLAHINFGEGDIRYFKSVAEAEKKFKDFDKYWSGHAMFIDKPAKYGNTEHDKQYEKEKRNRLFGVIAISIFVGGLLVMAAYTGSLINLLLIASGLCGLYLSWLIVQKELGIQSKISDKICSMAKHSRCESVLFSKGAKLFNWFTWGDVGLVYFTSSLVFLSLTFLIGGSAGFFSYLSMAGLVFPFYSIYYQWKVVKQWCMLCIGVLTVLTINGVIGFVHLSASAKPFFISARLVREVLIVTSIAGFILAAWQVAKQLYQKGLSALQNEIKAKSLKRNPQIFNALLERQELNPIHLPQQDEAIQFGNPMAPYQLVVACNPYCNPCAKAHHALEALYEKYPDKLSIAIRFALDSNEENDNKTQAVKEIIKVAREKPFEAVRDWYRLFSTDKLKAIHNPADADVSGDIEKYINWSKEAAITATPTLFVNGRKLPELYNWIEYNEVLEYELKQ